MAKVKASRFDQKLVQTISDAISDVILPAMDAMEERLKSELATKEDLIKMEQDLRKDLATKENYQDVVIQLDSIENKLNNVIKRQDAQEDEIFDIKKAIAFS